MDVGRAINYVFQDAEWVKKVAIGGLLSLIPIFGSLTILGYVMRNIRQVASGTDVPLPEWNDIGGDFVRGLKGFVALVVWWLPVIVLSSCSTALSLTNTDGDNPGASALSLGASCISSIVGLVLWFMVPLVITRVAMTENIGSALDFNAVFNEARQIAVPLLVTLLVSMVIAFVAYFGLILCIIGVVFTFFLAYVMISHLYGQLRRQLDFGTPATNTGVSTTPTI